MEAVRDAFHAFVGRNHQNEHIGFSIGRDRFSFEGRTAADARNAWAEAGRTAGDSSLESFDMYLNTHAGYMHSIELLGAGRLRLHITAPDRENAEAVIAGTVKVLALAPDTEPVVTAPTVLARTRAVVGSVGLTRGEVTRLVNQYIGVKGGYLGDFTYGSHADFYPEYCELDIDPNEHEGTTRQRFTTILSGLAPTDQAKVVRGVLRKFALEGPDVPATRTSALKAEFERVAQRLESGPLVAAPRPAITTEVVLLALADAEQLLSTTGPSSAVDRVHTALHGYLHAVCDGAGIASDEKSTTTALLKLLRRSHPKLRDMGVRTSDIERVLNNLGSILDALNTLRNRASLAHPNPELLHDGEARLVINAGRTVLTYLDAKLKAPESVAPTK